MDRRLLCVYGIVAYMDTFEHGTWNGYSTHKCRCVDCKAAASAYNKARKARGLDPDDPRHGTETGYGNFGCRCEPCREAGKRRSQRKRAKGLEEGDSRHGTTNGYQNFGCRCAPCTAAQALAARSNPATKDRHLRSKYGISSDQWESLWESQDRRCAVCAAEWVEGAREFHVDHDHVTGRVRAILCHGCNVSLGFLGESPERIRALADYIESQQRDYM